MARPASPEASACARIWAVDRGTGANQRPGSLPAPRVACRYTPLGFDRQHILAHPVGPSSTTTPAAEMTGPQDQAPVPPVTKPVTYEEMTPEHKQKYDEVKAQFEADLIGSFERTRNHGLRWKGFSPEGGLLAGLGFFLFLASFSISFSFQTQLKLFEFK